MITAVGVSIDRKVDVPKGTYPLNHSARLIRTIDRLPEGYAMAKPGEADFYDCLKAVCTMTDAEGKPIIFSDANEEHAIYVKESAGARKLRDVEALKDYFGVNGWYAFGETRTALRFSGDVLGKPYGIGDEILAEVVVTKIPEDIRRQIADPKFQRGNFRDVIARMNEVVAQKPIKYARGQVIDEMDEFGLWTRIRQTDSHDEPYALHAWLREDLIVPQDTISGEYEVAVERGGGWRHGGGCPGVDASYGRSFALSGGGFRPVVRGSVPERKIEAVPGISGTYHFL